jgi:hypothetical protein
LAAVPSSPHPPPPPLARPSVFISYASEDRTAARALRDTLAAAGLVVWYDENELGGGDAWDQKIRREIRDCDYFMPLVSAATERRKEGYFRREWRLAAERTLDMADDVLFLLPLVLDETPETGARVPDKFNTVQWLRVPGGRSTPALAALIERLLAGDHTATPRPPRVTRPPKPTGSPDPAAAPGMERPAGPPPMPPFPHAPAAGGIGPWARFFAEVLWWLVSAIWILVMRLPKWARILLVLWFVATLLGTCSDSTASRRPPPREKATPAAPDSAYPAAPRPPKSAKGGKAADIGIEHVVESLAKNPNLKDWARVGEDVARRLGAHAAAEKRILLAPVAGAPDDSPAAQFAQRAFASCYGRLALALPGAADVLHAVEPQATDAALAAAARAQHAELVLAFRLEPATGTPASLSVRVLRVRQSAAVWSGDFPLVATEAAAAGEKIAAEAIAALPKKPAPAPPPR